MLVAATLATVLGVGSYVIVTNARAERAREEAARVAAVEAEQRAEAEAEESARSDDTVEKEAQRQAEAAREIARLDRMIRQDLDDAMRSSGEGWEVVTSGDLYFRFAHDDEFTCGNWDCVGVVVLSVSGCPGGVYVEAAIESDGVVVGQANAVIGSLQPEQVGAEILENLASTGGTFRVNMVRCM